MAVLAAKRIWTVSFRRWLSLVDEAMVCCLCGEVPQLPVALALVTESHSAVTFSLSSTIIRSVRRALSSRPSKSCARCSEGRT